MGIEDNILSQKLSPHWPRIEIIMYAENRNLKQLEYLETPFMYVRITKPILLSLSILLIKCTTNDHPSNLARASSNLVKFRIPEQSPSRNLIDIPVSTHQLDGV